MKCTQNKSCIQKPVMNIEPSYCPPDILLIKKGIITKLVNQLVDWTLVQGNEKKLIEEMKKNRIPFMYVSFIAI